MKQAAHYLLAGLPGYMECGRDAVQVARFRPVAYWQPPSTLVALWPLPRDSRSGPYVLDAGNLIDFRSYPESDHEKGIAFDLAGPDYVRVPIEARSRMDPEGIEYINRWADIAWPDPALYRH